MKLGKMLKGLSLILIIGIVVVVIGVFMESKLPAQETIEVIGKISVAGFGPYETELVIDLPDGTSYSIVGEKGNELWKLQGKKIRAIGIEEGPTFVCGRSINITSYEILDY